MKALSVRQPFAELIACGRKTVELRTWRTSYRGPLLICAGANWHPYGVKLHSRLGEGSRGQSVCLVTLSDVRPFERGDVAAACVLEDRDRSEMFSWVLTECARVRPLPVRGALGLFEVPCSPAQLTL